MNYFGNKPNIKAIASEGIKGNIQLCRFNRFYHLFSTQNCFYIYRNASFN